MFEIIWGISTGLFFSSIFLMITRVVRKPFISYILVFFVKGAWQAFTHMYVWDVFVLPEHDTPQSISYKVGACHTPFAAISLLALYNIGITFYIFLQVIALVAASINMRFPCYFETIEIRGAKFKIDCIGKRACGCEHADTENENKAEDAFENPLFRNEA